ncbi:hypothetical protein L914_20442 [Phytophthora nicotianae]|uniref:Uncharacterized protein n=2 Tax=Phytophthora nicotianae TaxID=4792 RepID=V9E0G6_PHYNI|nr:hypothetical protein F443_21291 [Phytophthora nicotianae P1569]ETM32084.1 hypothetical protein L914_20442 [Phytophthora nicotianae]
MAGGLNGRLQSELRELHSAIGMIDLIARAYFVNHAEARVRWGPYCEYGDPGFDRMILEANVGFYSDLTILMEPTEAEESEEENEFDLVGALTDDDMFRFIMDQE